jgi:acyl-CoA synthetase (AMP-forming)/AMP-acid ligase II
MTKSQDERWRELFFTTCAPSSVSAKPPYTSFLMSPRLCSYKTSRDYERACIFALYKCHALATAVSRCVIGLPMTKAIPSRSSYDIPQSFLWSPFFKTNIDNTKEQRRPYLVLHASGSTGLPRPMVHTNAQLLLIVKTSPGVIAFQSLPFSHAHGLFTYSQATYGRKILYLFKGMSHKLMIH